jgi:multiple sugar transport system substrate-binding protein
MGIDDFLGTELGTLDDSVYGIPFSVDTFVFGYRPDLFEAAGVDSFPDTWDDMYTAAQALTADTNGDGRTDQYGVCFPAGSGGTSGMWFLANYYLWSYGNFFMDDSDGDGTYEVGTTPEDIADAMNYFNRFFEEGLTPQSMIAIDSWGDPEYTSSLGNGQCAMIFVPPSAFSAAQEQSEMPLLTGPDPQGSEGRISHLGGRALIINPNTEHPDEAWAFLKFLISQEFYENYYTTYFPAQVSLLENIEFSEDQTGYAEQLPNAITLNEYIVAPPPVSAMWESTNREFGAVYSGQKSVEEAASDLAERMQELLDTSS